MKAEEVSSGAEVKSGEVSSGSVVVVGGPLGEGGAPSEKGGSLERERCCCWGAGFGATPKRLSVSPIFRGNAAGASARAPERIEGVQQ